MTFKKNAITSIITSNYIPHALTLFSYIKESNPDTSYLVLIIGEAECLPEELPKGPEWIYWDAIYEPKTCLRLAGEYFPFELVCVVRGSFHYYLATKRDFDKWIMLDVDIGVLSNLHLIWKALDSSSIVLTPHSSKPVGIDYVIPHEKNILKSGLFNGGVVGMKRSDAARDASKWLSQRLEVYGHSYPHRQGTSMPTCCDFEFADQIWLNLMYIYFQSECVILGKEVFNLGHWNLHQGDLETRDGVAYFNDERVVIAHFSGLPSQDELEMVSIHSELYKESRSMAWAAMASEYLNRLAREKLNAPLLPYSYRGIQPDLVKEVHISLRPSVLSRTKQESLKLIKKIDRGIHSPRKVIRGVAALCKSALQTFDLARSILINRGENLVFRDRSANAFTDLVPCIGNYETFLVRDSILQAVVEAKDQFYGKLLDVGAGSSPYEELIMASGNVSQYIKLDFASSEYHQGHALDLTWDGKSIPLDAQSIDTVFMTEVLEHVQKPADMLREVRRVLKPGGVLFLTVPFAWPMHELPFDYHRFTPIALKSYLNEANFKVRRLRLLGGWDHAFALQIGLWLTNSRLGVRKRKIAKLLAWPIYSYLINRGSDEQTEIKNHQMYIGMAAIAEVDDI